MPLQRAEGLVREEVLISDTVIKGQENNLHGKPGQGYFLAMEIGTPPQKVSPTILDTSALRNEIFSKMIFFTIIAYTTC